MEKAEASQKFYSIDCNSRAPSSQRQVAREKDTVIPRTTVRQDSITPQVITSSNNYHRDSSEWLANQQQQHATTISTLAE